MGPCSIDIEGGLGIFPDMDSSVQAVVDWFGPSNFLRMNDYPGDIDHDAADSPESLLVGGEIQAHIDLCNLASPLTYIGADAPPLLILHGTADPLVCFNQSELLYHRLMEYGNEVEFIPVEGGGHGDGMYTADNNQKSIDFFTRWLRAAP